MEIMDIDEILEYAKEHNLNLLTIRCNLSHNLKPNEVNWDAIDDETLTRSEGNPTITITELAKDGLEVEIEDILIKGFDSLDYFAQFNGDLDKLIQALWDENIKVEVLTYWDEE